ncbi:MFS transporter [Candidatus Poribacteria bacterium]
MENRVETSDFFARALDFLGLDRNIMVMMAAMLLQFAGTQLWLGYTVKVLDALKAAGWMIGFYGAISAFMSAVAPYPAGLLSDRLGRGHALILASSLALGGYAIYLAAPTWWVFLPGAILVRFAGSFRFMSSLALTGDRLREQRRAVSIGIQSIFSRLPRVISPPLGGILIAYMVMRKRMGAEISEEAIQTLGLLHGFRWAVGITIVLTVIAIMIQYRYYRLPPPKQDNSPLHPFHVFRHMRGDLKRLLLADSLARTGMRLYMTFTPLYVLNVLGRGYVEWGSLQSLMAVTSIITYIPAAKLADRAGRHSRRPFIAATFFFFSVYPLALVLAPSATWLIPVFIISGLRETGEPARKALIMDLATQSALGRQMGTYYMVRGILISMAPLLGGLLWQWNPMSPFILGSAISTVGFLWFVLEGILFQTNTPSEEV